MFLQIQSLDEIEYETGKSSMKRLKCIRNQNIMSLTVITFNEIFYRIKRITLKRRHFEIVMQCIYLHIYPTFLGPTITDRYWLTKTNWHANVKGRRE